MTQTELNEMYKGYKDRFEDEYEEAFQEYINKIDSLGGDLMSYDWKEGHASTLLEYLQRMGFVVLEDPDRKGSSNFGWVIFPPKSLHTA